mgnify:CR=1 FL=1
MRFILGIFDNFFKPFQIVKGLIFLAFGFWLCNILLAKPIKKKNENLESEIKLYKSRMDSLSKIKTIDSLNFAEREAGYQGVLAQLKAQKQSTDNLNQKLSKGIRIDLVVIKKGCFGKIDSTYKKGYKYGE